MLRVCYQRVTIPGTPHAADRTVYVAHDAILAAEELDPNSGAPNTLIHLAGGLTFAVAETCAELFERVD